MEPLSTAIILAALNFTNLSRNTLIIIGVIRMAGTIIRKELERTSHLKVNHK